MGFDTWIRSKHGVHSVVQLRFFFFIPYLVTLGTYTRRWEAENHLARINNLL